MQDSRVGVSVVEQALAQRMFERALKVRLEENLARRTAAAEELAAAREELAGLLRKGRARAVRVSAMCAAAEIDQDMRNLLGRRRRRQPVTW